MNEKHQFVTFKFHGLLTFSISEVKKILTRLSNTTISREISMFIIRHIIKQIHSKTATVFYFNSIPQPASVPTISKAHFSVHLSFWWAWIFTIQPAMGFRSTAIHTISPFYFILCHSVASISRKTIPSINTIVIFDWPISVPSWSWCIS